MRVGLLPRDYGDFYMRSECRVPTVLIKDVHVHIYSDHTVGQFAPGTIWVRTYMPPPHHRCTLKFNIVGAREYRDILRIDYEETKWEIEMPLRELQDWCEDGRGIRIMRFSYGALSRPDHFYEFIFEAPGSREEFLFRWNAPKPVK